MAKVACSIGIAYETTELHDKQLIPFMPTKLQLKTTLTLAKESNTQAQSDGILTIVA